MVDSTYRWAVVLVLTAALVVSLLPGSYRKGYPGRMPRQLMGGGAILIGGGVIVALVFQESIIDALLLRAPFDFMFPNSGIYGDAWFFVFGYAILLTGATLLVIGAAMTRLGRLPPWIKDGQKKDDKSGA